jgi:hypothetical protein
LDFHLFEIPLREAENGRGEPRLVLYLVRGGKRMSSLPVSEFCTKLNDVLDLHGLGYVKVSSPDIIFAIRSSNWRNLERKRRTDR